MVPYYILKPLETKKESKNSWLYLFLSGGHPSQYSGPDEQDTMIYEFKNSVLDMQNHVIDSSFGLFRSLVLEGNDSLIKNGIILNFYLTLGTNDYLPPQFLNEKIIGDESLYAKQSRNEVPIQNFIVTNLRGTFFGITLNSWGGEF